MRMPLRAQCFAGLLACVYAEAPRGQAPPREHLSCFSLPPRPLRSLIVRFSGLLVVLACTLRCFGARTSSVLSFSFAVHVFLWFYRISARFAKQWRKSCLGVSEVGETIFLFVPSVVLVFLSFFFLFLLAHASPVSRLGEVDPRTSRCFKTSQKGRGELVSWLSLEVQSHLFPFGLLRQSNRAANN